MTTHSTHQSLTHRLDTHHLTFHGTTMSVPHKMHYHPDADERLHPNSAIIPEVAYV